MANKLLNRVKQNISGSPGTGSLTLTTAISGFQTMAGAGASDSDTVPYVLESGSDWEIGVGTYSTTGPTLARTTVTASSNSGSKITAGSGSIVMVSPLAADMQAGTAARNLVALDGSAKIATALIPTIPIAQGGTNATDAATARTNLGLSTVASSGSAADLTTGTLSAARLPAFTGNVTTSAGSSATTIANAAVTQAMLASNVVGVGPAFVANSTAATLVNAAVYTKLMFGTAAYDTNSAYSSGRFTAPVSGYYQINFAAQCGGSGAPYSFSVYLYKNGSSIVSGGNNYAFLYSVVTGSGMVYLSATQYVEVYVVHNFIDGGLNQLFISPVTFSGFLARAA